ncbi:MAG: hypothetical protein ABF675_05370, partial [Zymomonas mobilis]|uniref:hypothetical protein n=1 Tax=Zymomonas mobilis TaxID=542 RepID=UPI0039EBF546
FCFNPNNALAQPTKKHQKHRPPPDLNFFKKKKKKKKTRQQRTFPATVFSQDKENPLPLDIF